MPAPRLEPRLGFAAGFLTLALLAGACGDSSPATGSGEASAASEGVARSFCPAVADLDAATATTPAGEARPPDADAEVRAVIELLPPTSPLEVRAFFADAETYLTADTATAEFVEATDSLAVLDTSTVRTFLDQTCPGVELLVGGALDGLLQTTVAAPATTQPAPATSATSAADEPTSETSSPTDTTGSVQEVVLLDRESATGLEVSYESTTISIDGALATNGALSSYVDSYQNDPPNVLILDVFMTSEAERQQFFALADLLLIGPDGRGVPPIGFYSPAGEEIFGIQIEGRASLTTRIPFPVEGLLENLDGYSLAIDRDQRVPQHLQLDGIIPTGYPIPLEISDEVFAVVVPTSTDGCDDTWNMTLTSAQVVLEGGEDEPVDRSARGTRLVHVEIDAVNATDPDPEGFLCDITTGQLFGVNFRLVVDGRPIAPKFAPLDFNNVDLGTAGVRRVTFEVPTDSTELTLLGHDDDDVLATWTVEMPTIPGE